VFDGNFLILLVTSNTSGRLPSKMDEVTSYWHISLLQIPSK